MQMRFLILDTRYDRSIKEWYARHPGLDRLTYDEQRASFRSSLIGETQSQAAALRQLGHEALDIVFNLLPAQAAWAREHHMSVKSEPRWGLRLRRGIVPWPIRQRDSHWLAGVLLRQIDEYRPEVIHVSAMDTLEPALIREVRRRCRFMVGQIAARLPIERALLGYDLILSSLPNFVDRFRNAGVDAEWLPLAFDPTALAVAGPGKREIAVSFAGSLFDVHSARIALIEAIAARTRIDVWSADATRLRHRPASQLGTHPGVWGADMYRVLASSRQTVNLHAVTEDIAPVDANNFRLFEATGMGALLVTDRLRTLGQLFHVGREVVDYGSPDECADLVSYYVDHPDEATSIAAAGQARTLREHTWTDRMEREAAMIGTRI
jgi:spore maturation protein CgeB